MVGPHGDRPLLFCLIDREIAARRIAVAMDHDVDPTDRPARGCNQAHVAQLARVSRRYGRPHLRVVLETRKDGRDRGGLFRPGYDVGRRGDNRHGTARRGEHPTRTASPDFDAFDCRSHPFS